MHGLTKILILLLVLQIGAFDALYAQVMGRKKHKEENSGTIIDKKEATEAFIEGTKARLLGDMDKATQQFSLSLEMDPGSDAACYELAQIYLAREDWTSAIRMSEKAMDLDPRNPYYKLLAMDIYGKSGRKDDLLKTCQQLVRQYPENIDYRFELASAYLLQSKADEALDEYDHIESMTGITEEVSLQKHRIYLLINKTGKAVEELEGLIEAFPEDSPKYYSMIAEIYMQDNQPDKAAGYYNKIVASDPGNPYVHISLSDYYRKKGDSARWIEELKLGFANPALDVETKIRILSAFFTDAEIFEQKKKEVEELTTIILSTHPGDARALTLNADLLFNNQKYAEARECYQKVLAIDSSRYAVWESLLQTEASLSDWKSLSMESSRAMDLFPFQPLPYLFNGIAELQLKKPEEAIKVLKSGSKLVAANEKLLIQFHTYLGDAYHQAKQFDLSDENYEKVLKLEPDNSYVLNNYAYYLSLRGDRLDEALRMSKKGAELDSLNPANLDTYGWVLYKMKRYAEAKEWVWKAITLSPKEDPDLLEHYADIEYKLGNKDRALEFWLKSVKAGGDTEELKNKIKNGVLKD